MAPFGPTSGPTLHWSPRDFLSAPSWSELPSASIVTKTRLARPRTSGGSGRELAGTSPDSGYEQLCPCHVLRVFVAECFEHHPFLYTDTKCEENSKRHEVRRPYNPVWKHERLADGVEEERCVHWMTDIAVDPLRYESM